MRIRVMVALILVTAALGPASAQQAQRGGIRTETQSRLAGENSGYDLLFNMLGLIGLLGFLGLDKKHDEDSYHPAAID